MNGVSMRDIISMVIEKVKNGNLSEEEAVTFIELIIEKEKAKEKAECYSKQTGSSRDDWRALEDKVNLVFRTVLNKIVDRKTEERSKKASENEQTENEKEYRNEWVDLASRLEKDVKDVLREWLDKK